MKLSSRIGFATALALLLVRPATAQVVEYTDRTAFNAAAGSTTLIDFNDQVTPPDTYIAYPGATTVISGVTFSSNGALFTVTPAYDSGYNLGDGAVLSWQVNNPNVLTITLPANVFAVGMDIASFGGVPFSILLSTGDAFTPTSGIGAALPVPFEGFVSSTPITSLTLSVTGDAGPMLDRFAFTSVAAVPEPGTCALLLGSVAGVCGLVIRRRK